MDFALCHPPLKPLVFIEVKQVGQIKGAERQLFEYAFHTGVPIAILTDGREWHFFQPGGQGDYKERRVYNLDLLETDNQESAGRLNRYLNYELIRTGEAVRAIEDDYRNIFKRRQIEISLPEAWIKLMEDADEFLLDVVAEKTESCVGINNQRTGVGFLKSLEKTELSSRKVPFHQHQVPRARLHVLSLHVLSLLCPMENRLPIVLEQIPFVEVIEKLGIEKVKNLGDK